MVIEEYRKTADSYMGPLARYMKNANPNNLTILAFIFALFAGVSFILCQIHQVFLLTAATFIGLNGLFDALDGRVARLSRKASQKGDFLDHVLDRYADVFIIGGIMLSPYCTPVIGLLALIGIIFASYMGTQAQAVGCGRKYAGVLSRADRLLILLFTPLIQYIILISERQYLFRFAIGSFNFTITEFVMLGFAILGHITAIQRVYYTWKELGARDKKALPEKNKPNK